MEKNHTTYNGLSIFDELKKGVMDLTEEECKEVLKYYCNKSKNGNEKKSRA